MSLMAETPKGETLFGMTLYQKIWDAHVVDRLPDGTCMLLVDRQLIYETLSKYAFEGLERSGRGVRRPDATLAIPDHTVPTKNRTLFARRPSRLVEGMRRNCEKHSIPYIPLEDMRHGIVHVTGPEQGFTLPGLIIACSDSHTSTHGALGALGFGVGSSDVEHVLSTQVLMLKPSPTMRVTITGSPSDELSGKDIALELLRVIGCAGALGFAIEFTGSVVRRMSMEARFTLCNMAVETGARTAIIAPDSVTYDWLKDRPFTPRGELWQQAVAYWDTLFSDHNARFEADLEVDVSNLRHLVTWGTSPDQSAPVDGTVPHPDTAPDLATSARWRAALDYMKLKPGIKIRDIRVDRVFIGSCTNSRLDDLRAAAAVARGRCLAPGVKGIVVPGSRIVKSAAESEGLDIIMRNAGFEWRDPGCSMCFGNIYDSVPAGARCASTSNRNFENRQGNGSFTHLVSPAMAAAAGVAGRFIDPRELAH